MDYYSEPQGDEKDVKILVEQYEEALANDRAPMMAEDAVEKIVEYYEGRGHYDKALAIIDSAIGHYPYSGHIFWRKAQLLFDLKICEDALDNLDRAQIFEPGEVGIYLLRSEILTFQSRYIDALTEIKLAMDVADEREYADIWLHKADVYEDWEKHAEVFHCLRQCLTEDPTNTEALNRMNYSMEIADRYEDAIVLHKKIIDREPYSHWAWYNLACAYAGLELFEMAVDSMLYVTAIDEELSYAYRDLAQFYHELEEYNSSLDMIKTYKSKTKADADIFLLEGKCHFELGEMKASRYCFRKAIRVQASAHEALYNLAMTYMLESKWKQAAQNLRQAVELAPENGEYLIRLAEVAIQMENYEEVRYCCNMAIRMNVANEKTYICLSLAHLFNEEMVEAVDILDRGIAATKKVISLRYVRAALLLLSNKRKKATVELEDLLEHHPDESSIVFRYFPFLSEDEGVRNLCSQFDIPC